MLIVSEAQLKPINHINCDPGKTKNLVMSTLFSFIIIQNIIDLHCIGIINDSQCVPFDSISYHPDTSNQSHQIDG